MLVMHSVSLSWVTKVQPLSWLFFRNYNQWTLIPAQCDIPHHRYCYCLRHLAQKHYVHFTRIWLQRARVVSWRKLNLVREIWYCCLKHNEKQGKRWTARAQNLYVIRILSLWDQTEIWGLVSSSVVSPSVAFSCFGWWGRNWRRSSSVPRIRGKRRFRRDGWRKGDGVGSS